MSKDRRDDDPGKETVDLQRRRLITAATGVAGAAGIGLLATPLVESMEPDAGVKAASTATVDISGVGPGEQRVVKWQDKPVFIVNRTPQMLATLDRVTPLLRDPNNEQPQQPAFARNPYRALKPQWLVMVGVCTHLCCSPVFRPQPGSVRPGWLGGYHCPCHGSFYDLSGRVFKDVPAPLNMAIPEYSFSDDGSKVTITSLDPGTKVC